MFFKNDRYTKIRFTNDSDIQKIDGQIVFNIDNYVLMSPIFEEYVPGKLYLENQIVINTSMLQIGIVNTSYISNNWFDDIKINAIKLLQTTYTSMVYPVCKSDSYNVLKGQTINVQSLVPDDSDKDFIWILPDGSELHGHSVSVTIPSDFPNEEYQIIHYYTKNGNKSPYASIFIRVLEHELPTISYNITPNEIHPGDNVTIEFTSNPENSINKSLVSLNRNHQLEYIHKENELKYHLKIKASCPTPYDEYISFIFEDMYHQLQTKIIKIEVTS